jgi:hypothetical protein
MYEKQVDQIIKNTSPSMVSSDNQRSWPTWAIILLVFVALAGVAGLAFLIYKLVNVIKKPKQENYQYLNHILKKDCNLSLPDYITILNDTTNTQSISLQELCQNWDCNVEKADQEKVLKMIATVSKPAIVKCLKNEDWLRLALINLKIYDIMNLFDKSFLAERALTNGVYGVEYINIPKEHLIEIIKYTQTNLNEKTAKEFSKKNEFGKDDEESLVEYTNFVNKFLKEGESILSEVMNCENTNPFIFALITTLSIGNIVFKQKSGC